MMTWQCMIDLFICSVHLVLSAMFSLSFLASLFCLFPFWKQHHSAMRCSDGFVWFVLSSVAFAYFFKFSLLDLRYLLQLMKAHNHPLFSQDNRLLFSSPQSLLSIPVDSRETLYTKQKALDKGFP